MFFWQALDRLCGFGGEIFNALGFIQDDGLRREFFQGFLAPAQCRIGHGLQVDRVEVFGVLHNLLGRLVDQRVLGEQEYFGFGGYFNVATSYSDFNGDISLVELGLSFKPRLAIKDAIDTIDLLATLEAEVGFRGLLAEFGTDSTGLGLNLGIDLRARFENGYSVFMENTETPRSSNWVT